VRTKSHKDGREEVLEGTLDLPADVYNGMVLTIEKNLAKGARENRSYRGVHPPRRASSSSRWRRQASTRCWSADSRRPQSTTRSIPSLGSWLKLFATLLGRMPADYHVWIATDDVPAFVRFEGPLNPTGPAWRIELTSQRWPDKVTATPGSH
jgi:hypothetical protein